MNRSVTPCVARVEALEPRLFLSGPPPYPFLSAGITFDPASQLPSGMFWAEGTVYADDSFTGTYERFDAAGPQGPGPLPWAGFTRPDNDRMELLPAWGFNGYASQSASQFIAQQGFPMGAFVGRDQTGAVLDVGMFAEPYVLGPLGVGVYLQQDYLVATMAVLTPLGGLETATLVATPSSFKSPSWTFEYLFADGRIETRHVQVESITPTVTVFNDGVRIYSTQRASTNFVVLDTDGTDGIVGFGTGLVRWDKAPDSVSAEDIPGLYRGHVITSGIESASFFGVDGAPAGLVGQGVAEIVIHVESVGRFTLYRADEYAQGLRQPVNSGAWSYIANPRSRRELDLGRVQLTGEDGRVATFRVARHAAAILVPIGVVGSPLTFNSAAPNEDVFGLLTFGKYTAIPAGLNVEDVVFSVNEEGHVIAHQHAISSDPAKVGWYWLDLTDDAGGAPVLGPLYSWHDYTFERAAVVGRSADGDLLLWERALDRWTFTNLTQELPGAEGFAGEITGANYGIGDFFRRPRATIVGTDANGKFIAYQQGQDLAWTFVAVEADGLGGEGLHPAFVERLAGFGTAWGGVNFAGRDTSGQIWVLWHSPALGHQWATNNLSQIAGGTPTIVSQLSAITTPWDAFQITGLDERGHIIVTWWAREVGWRYDGLTDLTGGPGFAGVEIASNYNLALNVINIVGLNASGDAVVYWWNPHSGWNVGYPATGLSPEMRPSAAMLFDGFRVRYSHIPGLDADFQTITWEADDGHVMRLQWYSAVPDAWTLTDLTEIADPL